MEPEMPSPSEVLSSLQPLFRDILDIPDLVLTEDMSAKDIEEWNSLNHMRLISATEQKFELRLTTLEVQNLKCVGDLAALVAAKLPV
jgi:acyl carrier protein